MREGKYTNGQILLASIDDKEFQMFRSIEVWGARSDSRDTAKIGSDILAKLKAWKSSNQFKDDDGSKPIDLNVIADKNNLKSVTPEQVQPIMSEGR